MGNVELRLREIDQVMNMSVGALKTSAWREVKVASNFRHFQVATHVAPLPLLRIKILDEALLLALRGGDTANVRNTRPCHQKGKTRDVCLLVGFDQDGKSTLCHDTASGLPRMSSSTERTAQHELGTHAATQAA